jgi:serine/threonine-protein kinase MRCK
MFTTFSKQNRAELVPSLGFFEIYDPNLVLIKNTHCAKVIDRNRVLLGTDDGLYCAELAKDEFVRIADKRVSDIRLCLDVDIIVIISGNRKTVRLFPISAAISGHYDQEPPKLEETRGCYNIATGKNLHEIIAKFLLVF